MPSTNLFKNTLDSPEGLADRIAEILGCPVTIEDSKHRIISYSKHENNVDKARMATIIQRKVPEEVINSLWKNGIMVKLIESDKAVVVPAIEHVGLGNRVAVSVRERNKIIGFIWVQTNEKTLDQEQLKLLEEAAVHVKSQLIRHRIKRRKADVNYNEFFWQMLTGHILKEGEIARQAEYFGLQMNGQLTIAVIEFEGEVSENIEKHAHYLTESLHHVHVVCRVFDENQLILLIRLVNKMDSKDNINHFIADFIHKINERLEIKEVKGSYGLLYNSPASIHYSYKQALKVLELQRRIPEKLKGIFSYQELGIYQFLTELNTLRKEEQYQNTSIEKLKDYDTRNNSDLLETLHVFLNCDSNVAGAASKIHVHVNTLNYRLKRITEITGIDLKDPNQKVTLYLDLKMASLQDGL
ncbi:hypothetical protein CIL05_02985 [Virgibacillus profundi]|uniref:PucR family transcriptional regulator n=1 Tax=Virgibacillus profundi TaxID=2024555 RepID=A0A2A2IJS1_9BACI|nr:PucR family transcriptional regulator [Virgibacillus profundi]PAV31638.1 hypothetical protein CIL05_02985 [Virgibacillus profundi]PXY55824.1 PucR family transcriptional regulator [Virgibacillus profundi]